MVRLMLVLAPVMCILSGIGVSAILSAYMRNLDSGRRDKKAKKIDSTYPLKNEVCYHAFPLTLPPNLHTVGHSNPYYCQVFCLSFSSLIGTKRIVK